MTVFRFSPCATVEGFDRFIAACLICIIAAFRDEPMQQALLPFHGEGLLSNPAIKHLVQNPIGTKRGLHFIGGKAKFDHVPIGGALMEGGAW